MFERFTDRARRVVVVAQEESRRLGHNYIGTEHLLLGILVEGHGVAAHALDALGVSRDEVRQRVEAMVGRGDHEKVGHIPFTPRAKRVLELSLRESHQLGHNYIGTEHILLALVREGDGVAAQVLTGLGVELDGARQEVTQLLHGYQAKQTRTWPAGRRSTATAATVSPGGGVWLEEITSRLDAILGRLGAIEAHLGLEPGPAAGAAAGAAGGQEPGTGGGPGSGEQPGSSGEPGAGSAAADGA